MQDFLNEQDEEDKGPYSSDEKISDEVQDFSDEDQESIDDDFYDESEDGFGYGEETTSDSPEQTETETDTIEEPLTSEVTTEAPEQGFRVMSFEDFITK